MAHVSGTKEPGGKKQSGYTASAWVYEYPMVGLHTESLSLRSGRGGSRKAELCLKTKASPKGLIGRR